MALAEPADTMRAAVLQAPRQVALAEVPTPVPGPGEALLRVEGCGVCGSDLAMYQGRAWFDYPAAAGAPGHETWGVVAGVGPGVADDVIDRRVAALSYNGFAEFDVAGADTLVALPEGLHGPFPGEAVACAMNVFTRSGIGRGDTVAVVGIGFMGALLVQLAAATGATVVAISRRNFARDLAQRCGAKHVFALDAAEVRSTIEELTDGMLCDVVVEATGHQGALDRASELVRVRGRLVIAGYHQDGNRTVNLQSWNWRGIDVVNAHERDPAVYVRGMREAVAAVGEGTLDLDPLITHAVPLDDLAQGFELALERPDGFAKAVVQP